MSKKKATMTLKDFHGGSIPSDLSLPSAPGVVVRPTDRGGFDRQTSWGNPTGRSDHRLRPASAGSTRNLDDKTPFLSHSSHIGRNFDEDERKPLDGVSGPRRTVGDESIRVQQPTRVVGPKVESLSDARVGNRASLASSQIPSGSTSSSYALMLSEVQNVGLSNQNYSGNRSFGSNSPNMSVATGQTVAGSYPNAWGIRKETVSIKESASAAWSAPDAAAKLAHASALEKVSSGRWNSKQHINPVKDAEVFVLPETVGEFQCESDNIYNKNNYDRLDVVSDTDYYEKNPSINANGYLSPRRTGKPGGPESPAPLSSESTERPKLKLLPRSKPLENLETRIDNKQVYQQPSDHLHVEGSYGANEPTNAAQSGFMGSLVGDRALERPKINLKPRMQQQSQPLQQLEGKMQQQSQPLQQLEGNIEIKRGTVFGGARPREVVLKNRGIDDFTVSDYESQPPLRVKEDAPKVDTSMHVAPARFNEKTQNISVNPRITKYTDKRDKQLEIDSRRNRPNEIWRNNSREVEKHRNQQQQQQQQQERPPSPETWRKPIENVKPASPDVPPVRSAVELAQVFSKSVSDPKLADRFSGPRAGLPGRGPMPFSRLTGPTPRPQINGY